MRDEQNLSLVTYIYIYECFTKLSYANGSQTSQLGQNIIMGESSTFPKS